MRGDLGVEGELGRGAGVTEVRTDDEHEVRTIGDGVEAVDDGGHRLLRHVVHLRVGDPAQFCRGRCVWPEPLAQHVEEFVVADRVDDRAEGQDSTRAATQAFEQGEGHGGLARGSFGGGQIDALGHDSTLSRMPCLP